MEDPRIIDAPARLALFGFPATPARVRLATRTRAWRASRALFATFATLGITPLVALVPPHVPWALLALGAGGTLALRRLREDATLVAMEGACPRCAAPQSLPAPRRLTGRHRFPCVGCHHELELEVTLEDG